MQHSPDNINTILRQWPNLRLTNVFLYTIAHAVPWGGAGEPPAEEIEKVFQHWNYLVKQNYPRACRDESSWCRAGFVLLVKYGNYLAKNPEEWTEYRQKVFVALAARYEMAMKLIHSR